MDSCDLINNRTDDHQYLFELLKDFSDNYEQLQKFYGRMNVKDAISHKKQNKHIDSFPMWKLDFVKWVSTDFIVSGINLCSYVETKWIHDCQIASLVYIKV